MADIENFEEVRLLEHVKTSGLLDGFTDINGQRKSAPKLYVSEIDLTELQNNQRAVFFRLDGGDQLGDAAAKFEQYPVSIYVFGRKGKDDAGIVKGYAKDIARWLRDNYSNADQCITNIQSLSFNGPQITEDSRRVYTINLIVKFTV